MHEMIVKAGREGNLDLMEDGGLNRKNVSDFIARGMTVGEFSSPLMKGPQGRFEPGAGDITKAVRELKATMDEASSRYRSNQGLK